MNSRQLTWDRHSLSQITRPCWTRAAFQPPSSNRRAALCLDHISARILNHICGILSSFVQGLSSQPVQFRNRVHVILPVTRVHSTDRSGSRERTVANGAQWLGTTFPTTCNLPANAFNRGIIPNSTAFCFKPRSQIHRTSTEVCALVGSLVLAFSFLSLVSSIPRMQ